MTPPPKPALLCLAEDHKPMPLACRGPFEEFLLHTASMNALYLAFRVDAHSTQIHAGKKGLCPLRKKHVHQLRCGKPKRRNGPAGAGTRCNACGKKWLRALFSASKNGLISATQSHGTTEQTTEQISPRIYNYSVVFPFLCLPELQCNSMVSIAAACRKLVLKQVP